MDENSTKFNIVTDYCSTGTTLFLAKELLLQYNKVPKEKLGKREVQTLLRAGIDFDENIMKKKPLINIDTVLGAVSDMTHQRYEYISNVPHFHIDDSQNLQEGCISSKDKTNEELFKEFDNYSTPLARAFNLCALNEVLNFEAQKQA